MAYPSISPEILSIGPISLRWYGMMYVVGYIIGYFLVKRQILKGILKVPLQAGENLMTFMIVGMILGARIVYALAYNWNYYSENLLEIFAVWKGGLSFHGAALGMIVVSAIFARKHKIHFYSVTDVLAFASTPGLFFGRMGNFINAELYGRVSDVSWAMIFPTDPLKLPRHPSQLYQGFTEGIILFVVLYLQQSYMLKKGIYRTGITGATYLIGYGLLRFLVEFTREPDAQLGFVVGAFSMGQVFCFVMIVSGVFVMNHVLKTQSVWAPVPNKEKK